MWGLGAAILVQQAGLRSLDPVLLYGLPGTTVALSWVWARRGTRRSRVFCGAMVVSMLPTLVVSQAVECIVEVTAPDGAPTTLGPDQDPVEIDDLGAKVRVRVVAPGAEGADVKIWVEVGGFRIPLVEDPLSGDSFDQHLIPEKLGLFATPGLYHVGGTVEGLCSAEGYLRIGGSPFTNPMGQAASAALILGLVGTWYAGRAPSRRRPEEPEEPHEPSDTETVTVATFKPSRLEARIFDAAESTTPLSGFIAGRVHRIAVTLGRPDPPAANTERTERLTVVLSTGGAMSSSQVIELDPSSSEPAMLELAVPSGTRSVDVRLTAVSGGRIAHTVRLPSAVAEEPVVASDGANVAEAETTVRSIGAVGTAFDGAYLVDGGHGLAVAGGAASVVDFDDVSLKETVERIRRRLAEIVEQPGDFDALDAPGTVELLVFLAHHGKLMRDVLIADHLAESLAGARHLQVASSRADAYFPFELAYDFPAPGEEAALCPEALSTLASDELEIECPGPHDEATVCPFGFWGVSRVIERHAYQPGERLPTGFVLRSEPNATRGRLILGSSILAAASDRVDALDPGATASLLASLTDVTGGRAAQVETWTDWQEGIVSDPPAVCLLLPHTVYSDLLDLHGLEIGADERVWAGDIDQTLVPADDRPVVVVLLGCDTVTAGVGYERFPALFRRAGAEIVLGTIAEVLGRHAAPVAEQLVRGLYQAIGLRPVRFGEVMVRLRRTLLAQGTPMVLTLAAFGDADWFLVGGSPVTGHRFPSRQDGMT